MQLNEKTKQLTNVDFYLPIFNGFYESIFQLDTEYLQESFNQDLEDGIIKEAIDVYDLDIDYKAYESEIASACVDVISEWLSDYGIENNLKFLGVASPQYYNYSTDKICVNGDIDTKAIQKFLAKHKDEFHKYLEKHYSSRDGYISFIDTSCVDVWLSDGVDWDDKNPIEIAIEFLILKNQDDEHETPLINLYYQLDQYCDGVTALSYAYAMQALADKETKKDVN